jgi:hypothetical protein
MALWPIHQKYRLKKVSGRLFLLWNGRSEGLSVWRFRCLHSMLMSFARNGFTLSTVSRCQRFHALAPLPVLLHGNPSATVRNPPTHIHIQAWCVWRPWQLGLDGHLPGCERSWCSICLKFSRLTFNFNCLAGGAGGGHTTV